MNSATTQRYAIVQQNISSITIHLPSPHKPGDVVYVTCGGDVLPMRSDVPYQVKDRHPITFDKLDTE